MARTSPKTNTKSVEQTWRSVVLSLDTDFELEKKNETEYEMSNGRVFTANRAKRWPYDQGP